MARGIYKLGKVYWIRYARLDGKILRESTKSNSYKEAETKLLEQFQSERLREGKQKVKVNEIEWRYIPNKPATVNRLMATLKLMIHKGYQWEMLSEQTFKRVKQVKLLEENNRRLRYLSKEECKTLISRCDNHLRPIVIMALNTGCRKSEVLSLEWEKHIDLRHGFVTLDKTKNGDRREIPINSTLRETHRVSQDAYTFLMFSLIQKRENRMEILKGVLQQLVEGLR